MASKEIADIAKKTEEDQKMIEGWQEKFKDVGKNIAEGFSKFAETTKDVMSEAVDKGGELVDQYFKIPVSVDGETRYLELAPGLGKTTAKVLKDIAGETADLLGEATNKAGDIITQITNNNNVSGKSDAVPFAASTPKSVYESTLDLYKIYYGKIK